MGSILYRTAQDLLANLIVLIMTGLAYILFPSILVTILLPIYIFRFLVAKTSWLIRPDLGKILTTLSSTFVVDIKSVYVEPKNVILVYLILEGSVSIEKIRESLTKIVELRDPKSGYLYPELKQKIVTWLSFFFWKDVPSFQLKNHVRAYEPNSTVGGLRNSKALIGRLAHDIARMPFKSDDSPWEILVTPVDSSDGVGQTLVFIRSHHALADGHSLYQLIMKMIAETNSNDSIQSGWTLKTGKRSTSSPAKSLWKLCKIPILAPYLVVSQLLRSHDTNEWHISERKMARDSCGVVCEEIPIQSVKTIRCAQNVSFASVLLSSFAGGIRKAMMENSVKVPAAIHCVTPLPLPGHPEKLRNYMTGCFVKLPLDVEDPMQRLKIIDGDMVKIRSSTRLQANYITHLLCGGLPDFLMKRVWKPLLTTAAISSFPGMEKESFGWGHRIISAGFVGNVDVGNLGIALTTFSYNGTIETCLWADKNVIKTLEIQESIMSNMKAEIISLCAEQIV